MRKIFLFLKFNSSFTISVNPTGHCHPTSTPASSNDFNESGGSKQMAHPHYHFPIPGNDGLAIVNLNDQRTRMDMKIFLRVILNSCIQLAVAGMMEKRV